MVWEYSPATRPRNCHGNAAWRERRVTVAESDPPGALNHRTIREDSIAKSGENSIAVTITFNRCARGCKFPRANA